MEDLKNLLETSQARFPDSPLLWLRDVATFLNQKLVTEPAVSVTDMELFGGDPASALTANMRKVINVMFQKCSDSMKETFLETSVANTAHELQKGGTIPGSISIVFIKSFIPGLNVVGWNILTQLLTENNPTLVTAHIPRYIELRNSYQNRPNIGLAILWSVGQAGAKSLHSGIKGRRKSYIFVVYFSYFPRITMTMVDKKVHTKVHLFSFFVIKINTEYVLV